MVQGRKSGEIYDWVGPGPEILRNSGPTRTRKNFPYLATCGSLAETTNESADEGPIETLENPNTLEDAVNLQVQEKITSGFYARIFLKAFRNHYYSGSFRGPLNRDTNQYIAEQYFAAIY